MLKGLTSKQAFCLCADIIPERIEMVGNTDAKWVDVKGLSANFASNIKGIQVNKFTFIPPEIIRKV